MTRWLLAAILSLAPLTAAQAQISAGEAERCFQNPAGCTSGAPAATPPQAAVTRPTGPADYTSVLNSPDADRRKIQESLRTLDKYNGPIDGDLQSEATTKAISEWQKTHGYAQVGKLTPTEAQTLNAEAARAPIKRLDPSTQVVTAAPPPPSNADTLKALQARLAERRKAAEPKANAGVQALVADLKGYIAADGKGVAGDQFKAFAKWYADNKTVGRTFGDITPTVDDYGDGKAGTVETAEIKFDTKQDGKSYGQCLVFAWIEGSPRKSAEAFSCDDVAGVEKWKTDQALKSAWR